MDKKAENDKPNKKAENDEPKKKADVNDIADQLAELHRKLKPRTREYSDEEKQQVKDLEDEKRIIMEERQRVEKDGKAEIDAIELAEKAAASEEEKKKKEMMKKEKEEKLKEGLHEYDENVLDIEKNLAEHDSDSYPEIMRQHELDRQKKKEQMREQIKLDRQKDNVYDAIYMETEDQKGMETEAKKKISEIEEEEKGLTEDKKEEKEALKKEILAKLKSDLKNQMDKINALQKELSDLNKQNILPPKVNGQAYNDMDVDRFSSTVKIKV